MRQRKLLNKIKLRRKNRARRKIFGTAERPRLSVFRSNRGLYAQLIDDEKRETVISASAKELSSGKEKSRLAEMLGEVIAKKAAEKKIKRVVFDRGQYKYHGRVKAVAEGARKGGLEL